MSATGSSPASQASRPGTPLSGARFILFFATHSVIITYTSTSPACASRVYMSRVGAYRTPHIQDSTFLPSCFSIISVLPNDIQPTLKNTLTCRIENSTQTQSCYPTSGGDDAFVHFQYDDTLTHFYHSYHSVFAVLTTVVNIKLIPEPTCIFYELSVFYRLARSQLLSFILWCPRWDLNPHALSDLRF